MLREAETVMARGTASTLSASSSASGRDQSTALPENSAHVQPQALEGDTYASRSSSTASLNRSRSSGLPGPEGVDWSRVLAGPSGSEAISIQQGEAVEREWADMTGK